MYRLLSWIGPMDASGVGPPVPSSPDLPSFGGLLLKTVIALGFVLLVAWIVIRYGLRRFVGAGRAEGPLRVIAREPLDSRRQVVLVEAAGRFLLLGVSEGGVSLLTELTAEEAGKVEAGRARPPARRFADVLRETLGRKKRGGKEDDA